MEFLALIPATILPFFILWLTWKVVRKVWRVLAAALIIALASGCTHMSNQFDKSPCACNFEDLNTGSFEGIRNA